MKFKVSELDDKIKELIGPDHVVGHDRTLREQIIHDEELFGIEHGDLDMLTDDELNIHVDYLEYLHVVEAIK
jgi:hypothetical protein